MSNISDNMAQWRGPSQLCKNTVHYIQWSGVQCNAYPTKYRDDTQQYVEISETLTELQ